VTWSNTGQPVVLREMWVHLLAYYQARRSGQIAYSFAKFESMPVHYAVGRAPPAIPGEWNGTAGKYSPFEPYARYWDTVLVRAPDSEPETDPRFLTFRNAAPTVRLMARRGRFWLYDARRSEPSIPQAWGPMPARRIELQPRRLFPHGAPESSGSAARARAWAAWLDGCSPRDIVGKSDGRICALTPRLL